MKTCFISDFEKDHNFCPLIFVLMASWSMAGKYLILQMLLLHVVGSLEIVAKGK